MGAAGKRIVRRLAAHQAKAGSSVGHVSAKRSAESVLLDFVLKNGLLPLAKDRQAIQIPGKLAEFFEGGI